MSAPDATAKVRGVLESLAMPTDAILFVHVRLKDLCLGVPYKRLTRQILDDLYELYRPRTILVPTFTYEFTSTGYYDRRHTPSEVGRFGEEVRRMHSFRLRTMNPVFNVVDTHGYFSFCHLDESCAFGPNSLLDRLSSQRCIIVNINLPEFVSTHLHYIEYLHQVDYRFDKVFWGVVSRDGQRYDPIDYRYFVRDRDLDTRWRRGKIEQFLEDHEILSTSHHEGISCSWVFAGELERGLGEKLEEEPRFLIID